MAEPWRVRLQDRLIDEVPRHTPVVGHLDTDGVPEIVGVDRFGGSFGSALVVWEGDDGRVRFSLPDGFEAGVDPLIADLDGDGAGEIVVAAYSGWLHVEVVALDGNGQERWRSSSLRLECLAVDGPCPLTAADVDGDGATAPRRSSRPRPGTC